MRTMLATDIAAFTDSLQQLHRSFLTDSFHSFKGGDVEGKLYFLLYFPSKIHTHHRNIADKLENT